MHSKHSAAASRCLRFRIFNEEPVAAFLLSQDAINVLIEEAVRAK
jgi:hypothetical protein